MTKLLTLLKIRFHCRSFPVSFAQSCCWFWISMIQQRPTIDYSLNQKVLNKVHMLNLPYKNWFGSYNMRQKSTNSVLFSINSVKSWISQLCAMITYHSDFCKTNQENLTLNLFLTAMDISSSWEMKNKKILSLISFR